MLFPFHAALNEGTLDPGQFAEKLHTAGITGLEPMPLLRQDQPNWWEALYRSATDLGMECACADVCLNLIGETEAKRRDALDRVAWGVEWCVKHNCRIALHAGSLPPEGMSCEEGRKALAGLLARAAAEAEGSGVTLTIEDYGMDPRFACSVHHVLQVLEDTGRPDVKLTFDNGNFLYADEKPTTCFPLVKDRIVHVHFKDVVTIDDPSSTGLRSLSGKRLAGAPIGAGEGEVAECIWLIKANDYTGWASLEVCVAPPLPETIRAAEYLREVWSSSRDA